MDKSTLSNYGWIVIACLVLCVMVALASPFGHFIESGVKSTAQGLFDVNQSAGAIAGLNLPDQEFESSNGGSTPSTPSNIISDGGTYYVGVTSATVGDYTGATSTYTAGQSFPDTVNDGDVYVYGNYEYRYNQSGSYSQVLKNYVWAIDTTQNGWGVRVLDDTKTTYGAILEIINGKPITDMTMTFYGCTSLETAPAIPSSVTDMASTFHGCTSLETSPVIPDDVTNMYGIFSGCTNLSIAPVIPSNVTNLGLAFFNCTSLTTAPTIPHNVTAMADCFNGCISLSGTITIHANPSSYGNCLLGTQITVIAGETTLKTEILKTVSLSSPK